MCRMNIKNKIQITYLGRFAALIHKRSLCNEMALDFAEAQLNNLILNLQTLM